MSTPSLGRLLNKLRGNGRRVKRGIKRSILKGQIFNTNGFNEALGRKDSANIKCMVSCNQLSNKPPVERNSRSLGRQVIHHIMRNGEPSKQSHSKNDTILRFHRIRQKLLPEPVVRERVDLEQAARIGWGCWYRCLCC